MSLAPTRTSRSRSLPGRLRRATLLLAILALWPAACAHRSDESTPAEAAPAEESAPQRDAAPSPSAPRAEEPAPEARTREETPAPPSPAPTPPAARVPRESSPEATPPPGATGTASASIDLDELEDRLRSTDAIGFFTKLKLKNELDDLIDALRAHFRASGSASLAQLRERYDLLLMKVLAVLDEGDPALSRDLAASHDRLWDLLADPQRYVQS